MTAAASPYCSRILFTSRFAAPLLSLSLPFIIRLPIYVVVPIRVYLLLLLLVPCDLRRRPAAAAVVPDVSNNNHYQQ